MTICALCLKQKPLCDSHLIPAAVHRLVKSGNELIVLAKDKSFTTSNEIRQPLLCFDCEQLFGQREKYFLSLAPQEDGRFPLKVMVDAAPVITSVDNGTARNGSSIKNLDFEALAYFILSVFWRGSIAKWIYEKRAPRTNNLGEKYNEIFRRYLLGEVPYPIQARLIFAISNAGEPALCFHFPISWRGEGHHFHRFGIPGFYFILKVGNVHDAGSIDGCFYHSPAHVIYLLNGIDDLQNRDYMKIMRGSLPSKKLQKMFPRK